MMYRWIVAVLALSLWTVSAEARSSHVISPPYPLQLVLAKKHADVVYPSVAGDFLVYNQRDKHGFSVVRVLRDQPDVAGLTLKTERRNGAIRRGLALNDGSIGYVSDRLGPISAWKRHSNSDLHQLVSPGGSFIGGLVPIHLAVNSSGTVWAFDTYLNRERRARYLDTFANSKVDGELLGQHWRMYWSDADHWKVGYRAMASGTRNKFPHPALFVLANGEVTMIRNAFDAALSSDGKQVVFVREQEGNFDLWLQNLQNGSLTRLTSSRFADLEPAWSPDGSKVAFVSNRTSRGDVRHMALFVLEVNSGAITQVTTSSRATDGGPTWSGNDSILFHSNRDPRKPQQSTDKQWRLWEVQR